MLFNKPNAKKNPTRPWERTKITLFDRLEVLIEKREPRKRRKLRKLRKLSKVSIALAAAKTIRDFRKNKKKGSRRGH